MENEIQDQIVADIQENIRRLSYTIGCGSFYNVDYINSLKARVKVLEQQLKDIDENKSII